MIVYAPALDWITLTTFNEKSSLQFKAVLSQASSADTLIDFKIPRYTGVFADGCFAGMGDQGGRRHYLLQARGAAAQEYYDSFKDIKEVRCTTFHTQITIDLPKRYRARRLIDFLQKKEAQWKGPKRDCNLHEDDGFDSVYIGSETSDKRIIVYVKEGPEKERYLRFEVKYKRQYARKAWAALNDGSITQEEMIGYELDRLPQHWVFKTFSKWVKKSEKGVIGRKKITMPSSTFIWFSDAVVPAIKRLINDDDFGMYVAIELDEILRNWVKRE